MKQQHHWYHWLWLWSLVYFSLGFVNILFAWLGLSIEEVAEKQISFDIRPASLTVLGMNKWGEHAVFALNDTSYQWKKGPIGIFNFPFGA